MWGGICYAIHRYAKANSKYMKDYNENKESSYLKYWDVNNCCGWAMSQKLAITDFKEVEHISEFDERFIKNYNEGNDEGYFFEVDVQYSETLHNLHKDLPFWSERMKIKEVAKFVANWHDKIEYVIFIRNLKQALNHGLIFQKLSH